MRTKSAVAISVNAVSSSFSLLLHSLHAVNLLSFGLNTPEVPLLPLNVLIGANGSGKSNFIEAIALLRSTESDIQKKLRTGGGVTEWVWKGNAISSACINAVIGNYRGHFQLRHVIEFSAEQQSFHLEYERIEPAGEVYLKPESHTMYHTVDGNILKLDMEVLEQNIETIIEVDDYNTSILSQLKDPNNHPEITFIGNQYKQIRIYREWAFGNNTVVRAPQRADMRSDRLEEDFSNLGLFLNRLRRSPEAKKAILSHLRDLYEGLDDFDVSIEGGTVQVFFTEGNFTIPATRLSDGTLRYLCLLAILCDPTPPPLICIEEPELGLHPDIIPKIAELLIEASNRTQIIVTTHSDILVDAMTEHPENVIVFEKQNGATTMERLNSEELSIWTNKYRLGKLWTSGQIGGVRW